MNKIKKINSKNSSKGLLIVQVKMEFKYHFNYQPLRNCKIMRNQ